MIVRVGRWIACPDIETQFAPDNYMGSHSILFTFDTYTQTGIMVTFMLNEQWTVQARPSTRAPTWPPGTRAPSRRGTFGVRWVSEDNNDSRLPGAERDQQRPVPPLRPVRPAGRPRQLQLPREHLGAPFSDRSITKTEAYFMWQRNAELGGTPSIGPLSRSAAAAATACCSGPVADLRCGQLHDVRPSQEHFVTVRNEWWRDERGMRSGFPGTYTSHTIGLTHNFTPCCRFAPKSATTATGPTRRSTSARRKT